MSTITEQLRPGPSQDGATADALKDGAGRDGHVDGNGAKPPQQTKPPVEPRVKALWRFATSITVFTTIGIFLLDFEIAWVQPLVALAASYVLEIALETIEAWGTKRRAKYRGGLKPFMHFLLPAHITGLSISLMLYSGPRLHFVVFAVAVAVCSKFIFTVKINGKKRHFLNPSNVGIVVVLVAFPSVTFGAPNQYLQSVSHTAIAWIAPAFIILMGTMINAKLTKKMPLILGWLGGWIVQALARDAFFDANLLTVLAPMTGLIFWVFTNYMITDPGTSPTKPRNQVIFGFSVAILYGIITVMHFVYGIFIALTIVCAIRGLSYAVPNWIDKYRQWRERPAEVAPEPAPESVPA